MLSKEERIKEGFVGKKEIINVRTGEKTIVDFDDPESGCMMSMKDMIDFTRFQIKRNQKGFSEFTEEEMKLYSKFAQHNEEEEDDDNI